MEVIEWISASTDEGRLPFICPCDWNIDADEIRVMPWLRLLNATIVTVSEVTCWIGEGSSLDYVLLSTCLLPDVHIHAVDTVAWSPHSGIMITLRHRPLPYRVLALPRRQPWPALPRNPLSCLQRAFHGSGGELQLRPSLRKMRSYH